MAEIQGTCDPRFDGVRTLFKDYVAAGEELGASIVINIDGKNVVDIWGGYADEERTKPWNKDTIVNVWSTTKTVLALSALILVDRGLLDVNEKVSKYWPEFAANGKEDIEVRHFLSHTSGVSGWEKPVTVEDICDVEKSTAQLATQAPWWKPGTASGYHALSMGHLIGELVRRTSGKSLKQFVAEEIAGPLGADFQIGAAENDWDRITNVLAPPPLPLPTDPSAIDMDSVMMKTFTGPGPDALAANTPIWRRAEIGAANGHGNARSVARMLSVISLGGEVDGVRLLSPKTIDLIFQEQANGTDLVMGIPIRFGIGYCICGENAPFGLTTGRICLWGGWGGSIIIMDLDRRLTIAYMMNKMGSGLVGSPRTEAYVKAIYEAVGK